MFLHDINYEKFDIAHGDTLIDPAHWDDEPFEAIVSNPPYSIKWEGDANPLLINDPRFAPAGVLAPKSKADLAFTMHMLSWLAVNGTAAIVEFPGVLYRGGAEQKIRKYLVDNNYVDTVIQLPPDLFFGTTIATCIIVLKKSQGRQPVLFIDASAEFVRQGNKNKLTDDNQQTILDAFTAREDVDHFATLVDQRRHRRERLQHRGLAPTSRPRTRARPSTSRSSTPRSRASSRARPSCAPQIDAIVADLEGGRREPHRRPHRRALPRRRRVQDARRGRRVHPRQRHAEDGLHRRRASVHPLRPDLHALRHVGDDDDVVRRRRARSAALRRRDPGDLVIADDERERRGRLQGRRMAWRGADRDRRSRDCVISSTPSTRSSSAYFFQTDAVPDAEAAVRSGAKVIDDLGSALATSPDSRAAAGGSARDRARSSTSSRSWKRAGSELEAELEARRASTPTTATRS